MKEKISRNEDRIDTITNARTTLILKTDCDKFREECREGVKEELSAIKKAIDANRNVVLEKFDEVKEFMGYVKGKIEDYNGRMGK